MRAATQIKAIVAKETRLLVRDPATLLLLFALPAVFIVVLSVALQGTFSSVNSTHAMGVLLVDLDGGVVGQRIAEDLGESGLFQVIVDEGSTPLTAEQAREEVHSARHQLAVIVPAGSSEALAGEGAGHIEILVDPGLTVSVALALRHTVQVIVLRAMVGELGDVSEELAEELEELTGEFEQAADIMEADLNACAAYLTALSEGNYDAPQPTFRGTSLQRPAAGDDDDSAGSSPADGDAQADDRVARLAVDYSYVGGEAGEAYPNSVQQNVPGWTLFALFWIVQTLAVNIITERNSGAFRRILVAPVSMSTYLLGKVIPFFAINLLQAATMFAVGVLVLPSLGCPRLELADPLAVALITVTFSLVCLTAGLLLASMSRSVIFVGTLSAVVMILVAVAAGIMIPRFVMPPSMQQLAWFVPHGWALEGYLDILVRGRELGDILPHVGVLAGFAAVFAIAAVVRFRILTTR